VISLPVANNKYEGVQPSRPPLAKIRPGLLADQQNKCCGSYQHRNQNTDNERNNPMPIHGRLRSSAFLRCSETQPEEKFVHRAKPRSSKAEGAANDAAS
jgi:hypothetical protein